MSTTSYREFLRNFTMLAFSHPKPTVAIPDCREFFIEQNGQSQKLEIICMRKADLSKELIKWAYDLATRNLMSKYRSYGLRWPKKTMEKELYMWWARYLIVYDPSNYVPCGYIMFCFEYSTEHTIVHIVGIHVEGMYQNKGIGTQLMKTVEVLARRFGVQLLTIAVAKKDLDMKRFLYRMGFVHEYTSTWLKGYEMLKMPTKYYKTMVDWCCQGTRDVE
uniref:N-alpha-acetyltransferase 40 n=1 Tax=Anopheles epiroticus TaxID=199890 RepID=A0A182PFJ3_9DIPT